MLQKGEPGPGNSMDTPIADFALQSSEEIVQSARMPPGGSALKGAAMPPVVCGAA
jgi:hypothetical protein